MVGGAAGQQTQGRGLDDRLRPYRNQEGQANAGVPPGQDPYNEERTGDAVKITDEQKAKVDAMTYQQLLAGWRNAPVGDPRFQGERGDYWPHA